MHVLDLWRRLAPLPLGRRLFGRVVCWRAPYFATIRPQFLELDARVCIARVRKRRAVHNHIGTVHAIAMANLCELAAGVLTEAAVPRSMRWIPRGMTIEYLAKAETDVVGTARLDKTEWGAAEDVAVAVSVTDMAGREVVRATIAMYVSPRKAA
jgi:acyl-coenzyme A thioesterase PaaI-like protein